MLQVEIGRASEFRFAPAFAPVSAPSMKIYAGASGALSTTVVLTAEKANRAVSAIVDRFTLEITADEDALTGQTGDLMGRWFLQAHGLAQVPVHVSSFDAENNRAHLADPLPEGAVAALSADATLTTGAWTTQIAAGALGAAVNRAGYYKVEYEYDPDGTGAADKSTQPHYHSEAGRLRIVRTKFSTGLSHSALLLQVPQFSTVKPPNRQTWQSFIDSIDMISRVEAYLPNAYADQTLGEQWRAAHAFLVLAHAARLGLVPNVDANAIETMAAEEMARQASRIHWIDIDDDAAVDAAEVAYSNDTRVAVTASSAATTEADYTSGDRYRPVLNSKYDR